MALDRQRILGELGSVMKQLQSADCGCLGKIFGNSQQPAPPMVGSPLPTCGGCRRACCHGHGYSQYNSPNYMSQPHSNMDYIASEHQHSAQQPVPGSMYGFGPQIVNMMRGDHSKSQNMTGQAPEQLQGQLMGPMVIDAPQSPHGKVGLTPFTPPSLVQQGQFNPNIMDQGDVAGQYNNSIHQSNTNTGNIAKTSLSPQQSIYPNLVAHQMHTPQTNPWPQQNIASNPAGHETSNPHNNLHGQHSQGIAKFNKMFPGVKQGLGGDLGFDPMAIAIQMNPDNHLQSAMDTMNKIMSGNKGMDQMFNKSPLPESAVAGNTMQQSSPALDDTMQHNAISAQVIQSNIRQVANQQPTGHNIMTNQGLPNQQLTNANANVQPIPPQNQQIYLAAVDPNDVNQQMQQNNTQQLVGNQQIMDLNSAAPNLPIIEREEMAENNESVASPHEATGYPTQATPQHVIKEPIFPVDTSKNFMYMPTKQQKNNNYGYNTLGQPVEMLPAKMYHPPEPTLPQTLSPQPDPVKSKNNQMRAINLKGTVSKTSLMGNRQAGKTPSRAQLQHIYNQYKGSQSFTQQNVRQHGEGTCSDGRLNILPASKVPPIPVERIGGDTVVNNPIVNQDQINKVEQIMGQIGDVPPTKPAGGDTLPSKETSVPIRKCRNGLQDMVFSSYPTSAAWSFHGHGRNDHLPTQRFRNRHY